MLEFVLLSATRCGARCWNRFPRALNLAQASPKLSTCCGPLHPFVTAQHRLPALPVPLEASICPVVERPCRLSARAPSRLRARDSALRTPTLHKPPGIAFAVSSIARSTSPYVAPVYYQCRCQPLVFRPIAGQGDHSESEAYWRGCSITLNSTKSSHCRLYRRKCGLTFAFQGPESRCIFFISRFS